MKNLFLFPAFLGVALLSGCASNTKQTDALYRERPAGIQPQAQIENVPFINQEAGHCGPATLTMDLAAIGRPVPLEEITAQVYTPEMKGSLQGDMISAARRQGLMAVSISGIPALLREIQAGHPVIIFENLGISWIPQWHYALVTGYDLDRKILVMHSGPTAGLRTDIAEFELSWRQTDYWGLVVLKPGELAVSASELEHLQSAAALEQIGKTGPAREAYLAILGRWPESLAAYIGLGNVSYQERDYKSAVRYLKKARELHPESQVAEHNLAIAEKASKKTKN